MIQFHKDLFFSGSTITTPFGWDDKTFKVGRIHHAIDRAGEGIVHLPVDANGVSYALDSEGNSCLRCIGEGYEFRALHFCAEDLSPEIRAAIDGEKPAPAGTPIGRTGNVGLSVSTTGGDGRHVHYSLLLKPGVFEKDLDELAPNWRVDRIPEYHRKWGAAFGREIQRRGITRMNEYCVVKFDPFWQAIRIIVNTARLFGEGA